MLVAPEYAGAQIERMTVREFEGNLARLKEFTTSREALWEEFQRLMGLATLDRLGFSRLKLLERFFGADVVDIDDRWVAVRTIRGAEALDDYNQAVSWLIESGCAKLVTS